MARPNYRRRRGEYDTWHFFPLGHQTMIGEVPGVHNPAQGIAEDVRVVPIVVTPLQLLKVAVQMLDAHLVESPDNRALEKGPYALDAVGVHIPDNPLFLGVLDHLMACVLISNPQVGLQFIGVDGFGFIFDGAVDEVMQGVPPDIGDALDPHLPAALDGPGNPRLVTLVGPTLPLGLAAHKGFIHFHDAEQCRAFKRVVSHRFPDAVAEIPSSLVRDSQGTVKLMGRNSLLGYAHEVDGSEPLADRKVGIVHDGPGRSTEMIAAPKAIPLPTVLDLGYGRIATSNTVNTFRPPERFEVLPALGITVEAVQ